MHQSFDDLIECTEMRPHWRSMIKFPLVIAAFNYQNPTVDDLPRLLGTCPCLN